MISGVLWSLCCVSFTRQRRQLCATPEVRSFFVEYLGLMGTIGVAELELRVESVGGRYASVWRVFLPDAQALCLELALAGKQALLARMISLLPTRSQFLLTLLGEAGFAELELRAVVQQVEWPPQGAAAVHVRPSLRRVDGATAEKRGRWRRQGQGQGQGEDAPHSEGQGQGEDAESQISHASCSSRTSTASLFMDEEPRFYVRVFVGPVEEEDSEYAGAKYVRASAFARDLWEAFDLDRGMRGVCVMDGDHIHLSKDEPLGDQFPIGPDACLRIYVRTVSDITKIRLLQKPQPSSFDSP